MPWGLQSDEKMCLRSCKERSILSEAIASRRDANRRIGMVVRKVGGTAVSTPLDAERLMEPRTTVILHFADTTDVFLGGRWGPDLTAQTTRR